MNLRTRRWWWRGVRIVVLWGAPLFLVQGCGTTAPHRGRLPFSLMDHPPRRLKAAKVPAMEVVISHPSAAGASPAAETRGLQPGDVVAFHMSHRDAWILLRKGEVQKIPYELFRYGHIALVVPDPGQPASAGELRLLQVAMKQAVNADSGMDYLDDKSWQVFRPPSGAVDPEKLHEFTRRVVVTAGDRKKAYDYSGALGLRNAPWQPRTEAEIGREYSCATLVLAGLHYAGFPLDAVRRNGWCDIVTPRQVVESRLAQGAGLTRTR